MSETWTVKKILDWTVNYFREKDIPEARLSAEWLLADVLSCNRIELYVQFERLLTPEERAAYREFVQRRAKREPVQYILGETEFYGLPIKVTRDVLIPRPDTEILVDAVVEHLKAFQQQNPLVLDIGTGSGCIAIALAKQFPDANITALDTSESALEVARENARRNDVSIHFRQSDFFEWSESTADRFDIVVSNPPYIAENEWADLQPEVRVFEPRLALLAGREGLDFYRGLAAVLGSLLTQNGAVFLEVGHNQATAVDALLRQNAFTTVIRKDYQNIDRVVTGRLKAG